MGANKAQTKSFYRFLNNQAVGLNQVIENHIADYQLVNGLARAMGVPV